MSGLSPETFERARRQRRRLTVASGRHFVGVWNVVAGSPVSNEPKKERKKGHKAEGTAVRDQDKAYEHQMKISPAGEDEYALFYRPLGTQPWFHLQNLIYMPDTRTLENRVGADGRPLPMEGEADADQKPVQREPERCITFWNCMLRNKQVDKCAIFAMRVGKNPGNHSPELPSFEDGPNGSWGAEEGGG